ncbi:hypothetical protein [Nitrosophilus alvini]|uniref:hypothetical protein n=1 Tax=Nitrosophilus alvini TaxID=2714855 RepID=UPI00190A9842|nr:hypothetical protein [Nitrosophilus alvini]
MLSGRDKILSFYQSGNTIFSIFTEIKNGLILNEQRRKFSVNLLGEKSDEFKKYIKSFGQNVTIVSLLNESSQSIECIKKTKEIGRDFIKSKTAEDGWFVKTQKVSVEEFKKKFNEIDYLFSPFFILYYFYKQNEISNRLWLLLQDEFITAVVFKENRPIFGIHEKLKKNFSIEEFIKDFLHNFYKEECCYFIEEIAVFDATAGKYGDIKKIEETLLLPLKYEKTDILKVLPALLQKEEFEKFSFTKPSKKEKLYIKVFTAAILVIALFLGAIDVYIKFEENSLAKRVSIMKTEKDKTVLEVHETEKLLKDLNTVKTSMQDILSTNSLLKENIKNIFDLIPDSVVLTRAEFGKNDILLEGESLSKEEFEQFIQKSLKGVYPEFTTRLEKSGKIYRFVSIGKRQ